MNTDEKIKFINDVFDQSKAAILAKVKDMPAEWDGHELRQYIADDVARNVNFGKMSPGRKRAYNNVIATTTL